MNTDCEVCKIYSFGLASEKQPSFNLGGTVISPSLATQPAKPDQYVITQPFAHANDLIL